MLSVRGRVRKTQVEERRVTGAQCPIHHVAFKWLREEDR